MTITDEGLTLHWDRVANKHMLPASMRENGSIEVQEDITRGLILSVESYLLTQQVDRITCYSMIKFPSSWWQMLKRDHAPKWFTNRFPVKTFEHGHNNEWKVLATYPHADIPFLGATVYQARQVTADQWGPGLAHTEDPDTGINWR